MISIENFQTKINNKFPNENLTVIEYKGAKDSAKIKCNTCGRLYSFTMAGNAIKKTKPCLCQECGLHIKKLKSFQQSLKDKYPNEILTVKEFTTRNKYTVIECNTCKTQSSFLQGSYALKRSPHFCKICFPHKIDILTKNKQDFKQFIEQSPQWSLYQSLDEINSCTEPIACVCNVCKKVSSKTMRDYKRGRGCIYCCGNNLKTTEEFKSQLDNDYELLSDYVNATTKILLKHSCGFIYKTTPHNYLTGRRCPKCMRIHSKGENKILSFLVNNDIYFVQEYIQNINNHNLRFDFYLPDYDLYIEYQGEQHDKAIEFFGGENRLKQQQEYDNYKREWCKDKLIEIKYSEYNNIDNILIKYLTSSTTIPDGSRL